jgi:hypothetical protein
MPQASTFLSRFILLVFQAGRDFRQGDPSAFLLYGARPTVQSLQRLSRPCHTSNLYFPLKLCPSKCCRMAAAAEELH